MMPIRPLEFPARLVLILAVVLLGVTMPAGCAAKSNSQLYGEANAAYVTALQSVEPAVRADLLTEGQRRDFELARRSAQVILDDWENALLSGRKYIASDAFKSALKRMREIAAATTASKEKRP